MSALYKKIKRAIGHATGIKRTEFSREEFECERLGLLPRYTEATTDLPGYSVRIPDGPSFAAAWRDIMQQRVYEFSNGNRSPRILDCGANVGIACLFFKTNYPHARLTAFEPDPKIFEYLTDFVSKAKLTGIELIPKAVWSSAKTLEFFSEGADSGRLEANSLARPIQVRTTRLKDFLTEPVDFLKMDIEGAETEVLADCAESLGNVGNLFVEYHSFSKKPQTLDELLRTLRNAGFRVQIRSMMAAAKPFLRVNQYHEMDLQLNICAYRV